MSRIFTVTGVENGRAIHTYGGRDHVLDVRVTAEGPGDERIELRYQPGAEPRRGDQLQVEVTLLEN